MLTEARFSMNTTGTHEPEVTFSNVAGGIRGFQLAEMVCMHLWLLRVRQDNQSLKAATVKSSEEMVKRPNKVQVWVRALRSKKENASMRGPQCPGQISPKFGSVREPENTLCSHSNQSAWRDKTLAVHLIL